MSKNNKKKNNYKILHRTTRLTNALAVKKCLTDFDTFLLCIVTSKESLMLYTFLCRKRPENPTQRAHSAATTLQKNWRKETDKVTQLKEEVRGLRTDEHIKHLTKELQSAKQALERERKLRALQMDAIKVCQFEFYTFFARLHL